MTDAKKTTSSKAVTGTGELRKLLDLFESLPGTEGAKNLRAALRQDIVDLAKRL